MSRTFTNGSVPIAETRQPLSDEELITTKLLRNIADVATSISDAVYRADTHDQRDGYAITGQEQIMQLAHQLLVRVTQQTDTGGGQ